MCNTVNNRVNKMGLIHNPGHLENYYNNYNNNAPLLYFLQYNTYFSHASRFCEFRE